jgi:hypothetical protein
MQQQLTHDNLRKNVRLVVTLACLAGLLSAITALGQEPQWQPRPVHRYSPGLHLYDVSSDGKLLVFLQELRRKRWINGYKRHVTQIVVKDANTEKTVAEKNVLLQLV